MKPRISLAILVALAPLAASAEPPPPSPAQTAPSSGRAPAPASALASEGFTLVGEEKGVRVHRREKRSVEFAAEGSLPAPPNQVRRALVDYANHQKWQKHLKENKVLASGADSLVVYQRLGLPVIDDRDYTIQVTWGAEGPILWTRFAAANERGPKPVSGVVRVTVVEGSWRLEPEGANGTRALYRFSLDIAGSVPSWLGKGQAKDDVIDFFDRLKRQLPNYR